MWLYMCCYMAVYYYVVLLFIHCTCMLCNPKNFRLSAQQYSHSQLIINCNATTLRGHSVDTHYYQLRIQFCPLPANGLVEPFSVDSQLKKLTEFLLCNPATGGLPPKWLEESAVTISKIENTLGVDRDHSETIQIVDRDHTERR